MEIRLHSPHQFLDKSVEIAATTAGCWAHVKWWMPSGARFTLHIRPTSAAQESRPMEPASFEHHDAVIFSLLTIYPDARIRTARATYESLEDFEAQKQARVA